MKEISMNRVIAYSLYGHDELYRDGAIANAYAINYFFPGWRCRYYVSQEIPDTLIRKLTELGAECICMERKHNVDGNDA